MLDMSMLQVKYPRSSHLLNLLILTCLVVDALVMAANTTATIGDNPSLSTGESVMFPFCFSRSCYTGVACFLTANGITTTARPFRCSRKQSSQRSRTAPLYQYHTGIVHVKIRSAGIKSCCETYDSHVDPNLPPFDVPSPAILSETAMPSQNGNLFAFPEAAARHERLNHPRHLSFALIGPCGIHWWRQSSLSSWSHARPKGVTDHWIVSIW